MAQRHVSDMFPAVGINCTIFNGSESCRNSLNTITLWVTNVMVRCFTSSIDASGNTCIAGGRAKRGGRVETTANTGRTRLWSSIGGSKTSSGTNAATVLQLECLHGERQNRRNWPQQHPDSLSLVDDLEISLLGSARLYHLIPIESITRLPSLEKVGFTMDEQSLTATISARVDGQPRKKPSRWVL